jgi:hypothetical protein
MSSEQGTEPCAAEMNERLSNTEHRLLGQRE